MSRLIIRLFIVWIALAPGWSSAQIGTPSTHAYIAANVQLAITQFAQLSQQIAAFNADIAQAREAYFAAPPAERQAAGERFGASLYQKDMLIAMPYVVGGSGPAGKGVAALMQLSNGGKG